MQTIMKKRVVDVACGSRMFWFDKNNPDVLFLDKRVVAPKKMSNGSTFSVQPDIVMDFRKLELPDESFSLVVFDPPHVARAGKTSFLGDKYGYLENTTWRDDLRQGFSECFRVLKTDGVLVFKWNECHISLKEILALTPVHPLFGQRGGRSYKTHFSVHEEKMTRITFHLDGHIPSKKNNYRSGNGRFFVEDSVMRDIIDLLWELSSIRNHLRVTKPLSGPLKVTLSILARKPDMDGMETTLLDCFQKARLIENDKLVIEKHTYLHRIGLEDKPGVDVDIQEIE